MTGFTQPLVYRDTLAYCVTVVKDRKTVLSQIAPVTRIVRRWGMPKRSSTKKKAKTRDVNEIAFDTLQEIIKETEGTGKDPLAVALGRRGGLKGGRARAENLTSDERSASARIAARARWDRKPGKPSSDN